MTPTRYVDAHDGTRLAVYEEGDPDGPTVVLVHGWPDSHALWDEVVPLLAAGHRVIRYDNRGAGASDVPGPVAAYAISLLADDFGAVIDALSPADPVHAVGHDWGGATVWEYLSRPGAVDRVASYTSISGPDPQRLSRYIRDSLARPYRPRRFLRALAQALHFGYLAAFCIPVLAPLAMRMFLAAAIGRRYITAGLPAERRHQGPTFVADAVNGLKIYRANVLRSLVGPTRDGVVDVPVQLLVNTDDPFVRPYVYDEAPRWVARLWRRDIRSGHWLPMARPQVVAGAVSELVGYLGGARPARALLRAEVGRRRQPFGDILVVVTGAGSGIGRATAVAFAAEGAEVVVTDIDEVGLKSTVTTITGSGGAGAHSYVVDVSDAAAVERFADQVCASHGVPDIVVNNAGVGAAGAFLDTPPEQFDRVLEVNLGGW